MKELIQKKIDQYRPWMIQVRRHLHMHPETGDQEYETTEYIENILKELGMETQRLLATGVVGVLNPPTGAAGGTCVALRADIDALPIEEETGLEFASCNPGIMHACGHDLHMAALLCAARIFADPEVHARLTAPVKFLFQPAEETDGGADRMIKKGCLSSPEVSHVLGYHVDPEIPAGTVGIKQGYTHAASDMFDITVKGVKSHGAYPDEGVDAIVAAAQIVTALQSIVSRNTSATENCVITVGKFHGGTAGNIICDRVELTGTMRTTSEKTRQRSMKRLREVAEGTAAAMGASAEVHFRPGYIAQHNDDAVLAVVTETAEEVIGSSNIIIKEHPSMGVEDFSFYAAQCPSAFFFVGTGYKDRKNYGIHHGRFEADEAALDVAVAIEVLSVWKLMNES